MATADTQFDSSQITSFGANNATLRGLAERKYRMAVLAPETPAKRRLPYETRRFNEGPGLRHGSIARFTYQVYLP
jgi:hypothetical protein